MRTIRGTGRETRKLPPNKFLCIFYFARYDFYGKIRSDCDRRHRDRSSLSLTYINQNVRAAGKDVFEQSF